MNAILEGLRIVEGAAFVAAPLCGMTLAQQGADVIRFDPLEGGLDARRWPVTARGKSLYWAGLNKGKRSLAVDTRSPEDQGLATAVGGVVVSKPMAKKTTSRPGFRRAIFNASSTE